MRKLLSVIVALFGGFFWFSTFHPDITGMGNEDGAISILRWGIVIITGAISFGLWRWASVDAEKRFVKLLAEAHKAGQQQK